MYTVFVLSPTPRRVFEPPLFECSRTLVLRSPVAVVASPVLLSVAGCWPWYIVTRSSLLAPVVCIVWCAVSVGCCFRFGGADWLLLPLRR